LTFEGDGAIDVRIVSPADVAGVERALMANLAVLHTLRAETTALAALLH
jgi:hypothetical protein